MGETAADADRTRTGRRPHDRIQRNGREPDAVRTRVWPFLPGHHHLARLALDGHDLCKKRRWRVLATLAPGPCAVGD
eukprot:gene9395-biopygen19726